MHDEYYRRGLSRSPIFERYSGVSLDEAPVIALLKSLGEQFAWLVDTSTLPLSERSRVLR
jgi:hypothetical protein